MRNAKIAYLIPAGHNVQAVDNSFVQDLKKRKITHLITTDLAVDQRKDQIKKLEKFMSILIIDHHKLYNNVNSDKTIVVKPQLFQSEIDPSQYCASKLSYDLFSELVDLHDLDWLAVVGIIADSTYRSWKPFAKKTFRRLGLSTPENPFNSALGRICNLMAYYEIYSPTTIQKLYYAVRNANNYKSALNSEIKKAELVNKEIEYFLRNYERFTEKHKDLLLVHIKPKFRIGSILATRISNTLRHKTIVVAQEVKGRIFVSARRQDFKVAVNDLLEQSVKDIKESSAGGHVPAAGARFAKEDYTEFSKKIIDKTGK